MDCGMKRLKGLEKLLMLKELKGLEGLKELQ
jgi:hypothetical protein